MFDALFRNITTLLIDKKRMSISEIQLISTQGMKSIIKKTSEELLISEIIEKLFKQAKYSKSEEILKFYELRLISPELPGLGVFTYCFVTKKGEVFISKRGEELEKLVKASKQLSKWVLH